MSTTSIIGTIVIGFIVGLVARFLKPGNDGMGFIFTTALGVAGSFAATYAGRAMGLYGPDDATGFIGAVIGAIVLLLLVGMMRKS